MQIYFIFAYMIYKSEISTAIILDTRRKKQDGTFPVKLRVTFERKQKHFTINESLSKKDYEKITSLNPRGKYKEKKIYYGKIEEKAIEVINELPIFTFKLFEDKFFNNKSYTNNIFNAYEQYISELREFGQIGTSDTYKYSMGSLLKFAQSKDLIFEEVTTDFLKRYERFHLKEGKSFTTISMYLRCLKKLYNDAIASGNVNSELYPFGKNKYRLPAANNIKKALTISEIEKIFNYQPKNDSEAYARDIWIFSYLCNGMNIKDISLLQYKNIDNNKIHFLRAKTKNTSKTNMTEISVVVTDEVQEIINKWGIKPSFDDTFVFPILAEDLSIETQRKKIKQATKTINKYINRIAQNLGIDKHVTTYTARHSYSTVLKRSGASIEYISESLGHKNIKTTYNYLDSFEDDTKIENAKFLTSFKNKKN